MHKPYDYEDIYSCLCLSYFVTNVKAYPNPFLDRECRTIGKFFYSFVKKFNFWEIENNTKKQLIQ